MKECELCNSRARMYCESDQASLCWDCDSKVHSANFLVARHSRSLLCDVCQSPTPWRASGRILGTTASICQRCVSNCNRKHLSGRREEINEGSNDNFDEEMMSSEDEEEEEDYDGDDEDCEDDDQDGNNQVVPWTSTPPPAASSSTSSDESFCKFYSGKEDLFRTFSSKRMSQDADLDAQDDDDIGCSSRRSKYKASSVEDTAISRANEDFERPKESVDSPIRSIRAKLGRTSTDLLP